MTLDADAHRGIHARTKFQGLVGELDFRQHGLTGFLQRVGEARHGAREGASGQAFDGELDGLIGGNERGLALGHRDLQPDTAEVAQRNDGSLLRRAAGGGSGNERAGVNQPPVMIPENGAVILA